ncbi:MAG: response regulator [Spirochaetes bacterium]|nr:response regulator [Spirochaetota bacterium]
MRRILVADDERPIVESIFQIVRRDLGAEFEIAGSASTGREAIELASELSPDIILMDVRMPGISGLDAIREIKQRGLGSAFILVTAYERFDIAREAVRLGVLDYLLKPVSRDQLTRTLRATAEFLDRKSELERKDIEHREGEERMRDSVEVAFLHGVMLGERFGRDIERYKMALGIGQDFALVMAVSFSPPPGSPNPDAESLAVHQKLRDALHYKTLAFAGPMVGGCFLALLPLKTRGETEAAVQELGETVCQALPREWAQGFLKLGFGSAQPIADSHLSWSQALGELLRRSFRASAGEPCSTGRSREAAAQETDRNPFDDEELFLDELIQGSVGKAGFCLDRIIENAGGPDPVPQSLRYRVIALFGAAYRRLSRRGFLASSDALSMFDLDDIRAAEEVTVFALAVHARFSVLASLAKKRPRWSPLVAKAMTFIQENYRRQTSLELAADAVGISPNRLSRLVVEETGRGFSDLLIDYRIEKAKEMLARPDASIKQVSASCGYPDPNYFARLFKKVTGFTPSSFSFGAAEANDEEQ